MSLLNYLKRKQDNDGPNDQTQKKQKPDPLQTTPAIATCEELQQLLDFSGLNTTSEICNRFDVLARALLHDFRLVVRSGDVETSFEILELEFYLQKGVCHEDPFTHGSEEQKISGRWYFHRAPRRSADSHRSLTSLTEYRSGSRKGLDLTLGGPVPTASNTQVPPEQVTSAGGSNQPLLRGGALLRTIRRSSNSKLTSGPSLLVDQILQHSKASGIPELVEQKWERDTSAFRSDDSLTSLSLKPRHPSTSPKPHVYHSPRIGLDLSHPGTTVSPTHPRVVFVSRAYRYFVRPELLTANGRAQTFLGVIRDCLDTTCVGQTLESTKLKNEVIRVTGLKPSTAIKYLTDYRDGIDKGSLSDFVGPGGKGVSGSPSSYLKMMGTLEKLRLETEKTT